MRHASVTTTQRSNYAMERGVAGRRGRHREGEDLMDFFHAHQAQHYLVLAAILFAMGAVGVVIRRNAIIILMSIELMLNAVNLSLVAFNAFAYYAKNDTGAIFSLLVMAVAAAEATVGLALVIAIIRTRQTPEVDDRRPANRPKTTGITPRRQLRRRCAEALRNTFGLRRIFPMMIRRKLAAVAAI